MPLNSTVNDGLSVLLLEISLVFVRELIIGDYLCGHSLPVLYVHFVKSYRSVLFAEFCKKKSLCDLQILIK